LSKGGVGFTFFFAFFGAFGNFNFLGVLVVDKESLEELTFI
jgi:hypothetical protein